MGTEFSGVNLRPRPSWQAHYQAALFETDRSQMPRRIAEAESLILLRVRELAILPGDHIEEDLLLDDALYALRALRSAVTESQAA